jgi:hypothetical protein
MRLTSEIARAGIVNSSHAGKAIVSILSVLANSYFRHGQASARCVQERRAELFLFSKELPSVSKTCYLPASFSRPMESAIVWA